jgi:hypothetical protein
VYLPLLLIQFAANSNILLVQMIQITEFDIVPSDWINSKIYNFTETKSRNSRFELEGFGSKNFISNLGPDFMFMLALPVWFLLIRFGIYLANNCKILWLKKCFNDPTEEPENTLFNSFSRLLVEGFQQMLFCTILQMEVAQQYNISDWIARLAGYFGAFACAFILGWGFYFVLFKAKKIRDAHWLVKQRSTAFFIGLNVKEAKKEFVARELRVNEGKLEEAKEQAEELVEEIVPYASVFTEEIRHDSQWALAHNLLFMLRCTGFVTIALLLENHGAIQIFLMDFVSMLMLIYYITVRPFEEPE